MRKIVPLFICAIFLLCSCKHGDHSYKSSWSYDEVSHWRSCESDDCSAVTARAEHSFSDDKSDGMLVCSVCSFTKPSDQYPAPHVHELSDSYTASSTHHWKTCSVCNEAIFETHSFDTEVVVTPPSSDNEGMAERCCILCNRIVSVTLPRLPEKMSEEDWKSCFDLLNVRINERSKSGSLISEDCTYEVDSTLVALVNEGGNIYYSREILSNMDFSQHYDKFSHYGGGVYRSDSLEIIQNGSKIKANDVTVSFLGDTLQSISYSIKLGSFGTMSYSYTFSDWGLIKLSPTYFDIQTLDSLLDESKFGNGLTLTYQKYDYNGNYTESQLTIHQGSYMCKKFQNGSFKGMSNGDAKMATDALLSHLYAILSSFGSNDLVYEDFYDSYTYVGEGIEISGIGYVTSCDVIVSEGCIYTLNIQLANETSYYYDIYYA